MSNMRGQFAVAANQRSAAQVAHIKAAMSLARSLKSQGQTPFIMGKNPSYAGVARIAGGQAYNMPDNVYRRLGSGHFEKYNVPRLDKAIRLRQPVILSHAINRADPMWETKSDGTKTDLRKEIEYMESNGYIISKNGLTMELYN